MLDANVHRALVMKQTGELTVVSKDWVFEAFQRGDAVPETTIAYGVIAIPIDEEG